MVPEDHSAQSATTDLHIHNRNVYRRKRFVEWYASRSDLQVAEAVILSEHRTSIVGARILDIGVGGGRTIPHLAPLASRYVGVDYSPELVAAALRRYPDVDLRVADARDLSEFTDDSFDAVFFTFNGIDYVTHEGRLSVLGEVRRLLAPGGIFVFSTHNRSYRRFARLPWQPPFRPGREMVRRSLAAWTARGRRRRLAEQEVHCDEYAIINDDAHDFTLLTYYITASHQVGQLSEAGFEHVVVHDGAGRPIDPDHPDESRPWMYYVAR